ncbi:MAG: hypothetical protein JO148_16160 [Acidimicrobiia bacterium]|nr:hypothetical protein [Acidimicrobiia bacterium]
MRTPELRELLDQLGETSAPEPSPVFVAKLEADLRTMDQVGESARPRGARSKRARLLIAAGPVAALTAAAAAAAVTLLPSDPHPRQVTTADPGVTAPAPAPVPTDPPASSVPTPTTIAAPPWLPPTAAPTPASTPTTVGTSRTEPTTRTPAPGEHTTPTVVPPGEPVPPTTAPPAPTTTVPGPETLSLHCQGAMVGGSPAVSCAWSQSTSPSFAWYRLYREVPGTNRVLIFSSDMRTKTSTGDKPPQTGTTYNYQVVVTDSAGNVIGTSNVSSVACC